MFAKTRFYAEAQCSIAVVTEFTVAAARTRWRLQLASCDPDGPIRGSIEQDGLDPYAQAGFDDEYAASQTQKLDCWPRSNIGTFFRPPGCHRV